MPAPTKPVTVNLADFGGPAIGGVTVTARLSQVDYTADGIFVSTEPVTGVTDANGQVVLQLFPNALPPTGLGTVGSVIRVTAPIPNSQPLDVLAVVPNQACNLASILVVDEPSGLSDIQVAVRAAIDARLYPGTYAVAPVTRHDGMPIQPGDRYIDNLYREWRYTGAAWASIEANAAISASAAQAAQVLAEAARDAALGAAKVFTTAAQGLAATANGQMFLLRTADLYTFDVYYNNAGVAALLGQMYLASGDRWQVDDGTKVHAAWIDSNLNCLAYLADDGFHVLGGGADVLLTGYPAELELTDADALWALQGTGERNLQVIDSKGRLHLHGLGDVFANTMSAAVKGAFVRESFGDLTYKNFLIDKAGSELGSRVYIHRNVVAANADGTSFARFPFYIPISNTTGLLLFGQRHSSLNNGEDRVRQVCKSVTTDPVAGTFTLGATVVISQSAAWTAGTGGNSAGAIGVRIPSGPNAGRIVIVYNKLISATEMFADAAYERALHTRHSDDNGATWSAESKIMGAAQIYDVNTGGVGGIPGAVPARNGCLTGSGNCIIRIPSGLYAGRIVCSLYTVGAYFGAMYSDDDGVTWTRGTLQGSPGGKNYNETAIAFCSDGSLVMIHRCEDNNGAVVTFPGSGRSKSVDGGATWVYQEHEVTTGFGNSSVALVNASVSQATGFEKLLVASTEDTALTMRTKHSLKLSYDKGSTWTGEVKFFDDKQGVGYGCLQRLSNGDYVFVYETFNGSGGINTEVAIGMIYFNEAELMAQAALI